MPASHSLLYRQEQLPVFQNRMYATAEEARSCPKGDVFLVEDSVTGLIHNAAFSSEVMDYDGCYQNEQATSPSFKKHLQQVTKIVEREIGKNSLIEVGCGKAFFLEMLRAEGFEVTGFDPAYEGSNPNIEKHYFEVGIGMSANGIILRHVLEHIQDPLEFLRNLRDANGGHGKIYIEVPCLDWILRHRAWYDVFYEHVNYFRLADFNRIFGKVVASGRLFGDQYLYVVADLSTLREPLLDPEDRVQFPADFFTLDRYNERSGQCVVWGGASKGVIFSLFKERTGQNIDAVIDINPAKQGKYLPGTGLLVHSPDEVIPRLAQGSTIYVMNSNYMEEIRAMSGNAFEYVGVDCG